MKQEMHYQSWLSELQKHRAIAVIRTLKMELGYKMASSVAAGGMNLIEITWNSDRAANLIDKLRSELPDCTIGTGTLFNLQDLENAIAAGAEFLFTPHVDPEMIRAANGKNIPIIPGALTPTEIVNGWNSGADCLKVFPIQAVGGANYIKSLQGPLGQIPLIPTGGVTLENAQDFLNAGAIAVGLSGELFPKQLVEQGNWDAIEAIAKNLRNNLIEGESSKS
jgi:2-dehydro-3-deoxyphosphogluconate aldolase / (4S)-4-hydroxy-2-oxoglutarate aldolase